MPETLDPQAGTLQDAGLRATAPRLAVLAHLNRHPGAHWTAEALYEALHAGGRGIGLATVYRVLAQFEQAGLLRRSRLDGERSVYELAADAHHDHIVCLQCGHLDEFEDDAIEARQRAIAADRGFRLAEHTLALFGRCRRPDCPRRATPTVVVDAS